MLKGWLIYTAEDLQKNIQFAQLLQIHGKTYGMDVSIHTREKVCIGSDGHGLVLGVEGTTNLPEFVINRTRDARLSKQCELLGIPVFNSYSVTDLCNDKVKTQQFVNALGIPTVNAYFYDTYYDTTSKVSLNYPLVVKTVDGHGGLQVWKVEDEQTLQACIEQARCRYLVIQEMCSAPGVDVRVFVVGNKVLGAIKRQSTTDFRSNYSLGGTTCSYAIDDALRGHLDCILGALKCDCVGIDFMIDEKGHYLFNEIEDVVGSRSLYQHTTIDIAELYMEHIAMRMK